MFKYIVQCSGKLPRQGHIGNHQEGHNLTSGRYLKRQEIGMHTRGWHPCKGLHQNSKIGIGQVKKKRCMKEGNTQTLLALRSFLECLENMNSSDIG